MLPKHLPHYFKTTNQYPQKTFKLLRILAIGVYNLIIWLYHKAAIALSPFSTKAKKWVYGISQQQLEIATFKTPQITNRIWVHCSSLGEFEQARPLIEMIKENERNCCIYLTFFSPSGFEIVQLKGIAHYVFYLPLDTQKNAEYFIEKLQPTLVIWTKYDFFFHYLHLIKKHNIPCILFSARFLNTQPFFKPHGLLHREMLSCFSAIFVQNENSKLLLHTIKIDSEVAPDTRFDRVMAIAQKEFHNTTIDEFLKHSTHVLVAGSTWQEDEQLLANTLKNFPNYKLIIAPHQIETKKIAQTQAIFEKKQLNTVLYSKFSPNRKNAQVLIIDNIGMLSQIYRYAQICYVGGGFGAGIHNVLEAVVYGKPTLVGTNFHKSIECEELIKNGVVFSIKNQTELSRRINELNSHLQLKSIAEKAANFMNANSGGTKKIFNHAKRYIQ